MKKIVIAFASVVIMICIFYFSHFLISKDTVVQDIVQPEIQSRDSNISLLESNEPYKKALVLQQEGDQDAESLTLLLESRELAKTETEKSIIDFNIASVQFNIDRATGIQSFIELSKNTNYSERTRALAMLRAYLKYAQYGDVRLLRILGKGYGIPLTTNGEVTYAYMKEIYELYPFAFPRIKMIEYDLVNISDPEVAKNLHDQYRESILLSIEDSGKYSGESTEFTSTRLAYANLLGKLSLDYKAVSVAEVEASYEGLIDFDHINNYIVNKQYALLSYANYESGIGNYEKASMLIELIIKDGVHRSLEKSLPKTNPERLYSNLHLIVPETQNAEVAKFITNIGSALTS